MTALRSFFSFSIAAIVGPSAAISSGGRTSERRVIWSVGIYIRSMSADPNPEVETSVAPSIKRAKS